MILFFGCSITYGQGLPIYKWIDEGKDLEFINSYTSPQFTHENLSYTDDKYRQEFHYPNLVAKHFDKAYALPNFGNGGSNEDITQILKLISSGKLLQPDGIEAIVIQFTDLQRDMFFLDMIHYTKYDNDRIKAGILHQLSVIEHFSETMSKIRPDDGYTKHSIIENEIPWVAMSYQSDISDILQEYFPKNYINLKYKDKNYSNIAELINIDELNVRGHLGDWKIHEQHPSKILHEVMADGVIRKLEENQVKFQRKI